MSLDNELIPHLAELQAQAPTLSGRLLAENLEHRAWLLVTLQRPEEALELFEEQDEIYMNLGDTPARAGCWRDQAEVLRSLGRCGEALLLLDRYEHVCRETGDEAGLGMARAARAVIVAEIQTGSFAPAGSREELKL